MCEALRDFMKEEIDKEIQAAVEKEHKKTIDTERVSMIKSLMRKQGLTAKDAMETLSIPAAEQERYAQIL